MKRNTFIRGTTPTLEISMSRGISVENIDSMIVYFSQGITILKKKLEDVKINKTTNMVYVPLTELETYVFSPSVVNLQIRYKLVNDTNIYSTQIYPFRVLSQICNEVYDE
jgi:hypothetical protein